MTTKLKRTRKRQRRQPLRAARGSGTPDELEQACLTLCVGDFWCDAGQHVRRIYNILVQRKLMTCNRHGQMVEVSPNAEVSDGGPLTHESPAAQSRRSLH